MSVEETCESCTQNENVWVTTMDDQELCVDNLVEWGKYFSKFVTKNDECQASTVRSLSDTEIGRIIVAVVVAVVFVGWVAYALYLRHRRRSRDRYLLLPYVELRRGVSEDEISLATNVSFLSCSEADSSTTEYPQSSTQSGLETDAEPQPKLKIKTESESERVPESEPEPNAETEPKTKTEPESEPEPNAETKPKLKPNPNPNLNPMPKPNPKLKPNPNPKLVPNLNPMLKPNPKLKPKPVPMPHLKQMKSIIFLHMKITRVLTPILRSHFMVKQLWKIKTRMRIHRPTQ